MRLPMICTIAGVLVAAALAPATAAARPARIQPRLLPNTSYAITWTVDGGADSISAYSSSATGAATPLITIAGADTGLSNPSGVTMDALGDVYVANAGNDSITEYSAAVISAASPESTVDATPIATIAGTSTGLNAPSAIAIDPGGIVSDLLTGPSPDEIWVTDPASNTLEAFTAGSSGNELPARTIAGSKTQLANPIALTINPAFDQITVLGAPAGGGAVLETFVTSAVGNVAPVNSVTVPSTTVADPSAITGNTLGSIWVADRTGNSVSEYDAFRGFITVTPLRTLGGPDTGLDQPDALSMDAFNRLVVGNGGNQTVTTYAPSVGNDAVPVFTASGVGSGLGAPSALTVFGAAPGQPTDLLLSPRASSVAISWQAPARTGGGVTGYEVIIAPVIVIDGTPVTGNPTADHVTRKLALTEPDLQAGQRYQVTVAAMNGFGESVAATGLVTMPTVPSAPLGVHALGGHHAVIVRWGVPRSDGGDPVTGYRIEYATCSPTATGCGFTTVHVGSTVRSLRLNHLRARTTYRVCVLARSDVGSSHPSRVVSATTAKK